MSEEATPEPGMVHAGSMRLVLALLLAGAAACGSRGPAPVEPMSPQAHLEEAERKEAEAARLDAQAAEIADDPSAAAGYACGDTVAADQVTSGGERIITQPSCWETDTPEELRGRADRLREEAARHRAAATPPE